MKILFVVPYVPNPIRVRPHELLRTLAHRGHEITLATLYQSADEAAAIAPLREQGIAVVAHALPKARSLLNSALAVPTRAPLQASYCWQPALAQTLQRLVAEEPFDAIHVEHLRGARYGLWLRKVLARGATIAESNNLYGNGQQPGKPPIVWDSVDCISHLFAQAAKRSRSLSGRLMTTLELPRTRAYEAWLLHQFDRVLVTSPVDRDALLTLGGKGAVAGARGEPRSPVVLPNGVALEAVGDARQARQQRMNALQSGSGTDGGERAATVLFSGKMSYHANVSAASYLVQEIMPLVWAKQPTVRVQIVGKDPPAQIRGLATTARADGAGERQVEVTGTVPEMRPYLRRATIAAAPLLYGAGIQNKVLEAMACGTAVITSAQAASGIPARAGIDFLVADQAQDFADAILGLLADPARRAAIGAAGRAYVEREHSWHAVAQQLEAVYLTAAHDRGTCSTD